MSDSLDGVGNRIDSTVRLTLGDDSSAQDDECVLLCKRFLESSVGNHTQQRLELSDAKQKIESLVAAVCAALTNQIEEPSKVIQKIMDLHKEKVASLQRENAVLQQRIKELESSTVVQTSVPKISQEKVERPTKISSLALPRPNSFHAIAASDQLSAYKHSKETLDLTTQLQDVIEKNAQLQERNKRLENDLKRLRLDFAISKAEQVLSEKQLKERITVLQEEAEGFKRKYGQSIHRKAEQVVPRRGTVVERVEMNIHDLVRLQALVRGWVARRAFKRTAITNLRNLVHRKFMTRQSVIEEILYTERTYVRCLGLLVDHFWKPFSSQTQSKHLNIQIMDVHSIFCNIEIILSYNQELLDVFSKRIPSPDPMVYDIFLQLTTFFRVYSDYVQNFDYGLSTYAKIYQKASVARFVKLRESHNSCSKTRLSSLLTMPVERIPQYIFLLQDLLMLTPLEHPEYLLLCKLLHSFRKLSKRFNEERMKACDLEKLVNLQTSIEGDVPHFCEPSRKLILEGKITRVTGNIAKLRMVYLFNDSILVASRKDKGGLVFEEMIQLSGYASVKDAPETIHSNRHNGFIITLSTGKSYTFGTETPGEKGVWVNAIFDVIKGLKKSLEMRHKKVENTGGPTAKQGFLHKKGGLIKNWKRRYCVLKKDCMLYYKDENIDSTEPCGSIPLQGYEFRISSLLGRNYSFELYHRNQRTYYFMADSPESLREWVQSFEVVMVDKKPQTMGSPGAFFTEVPSSSDSASVHSLADSMGLDYAPFNDPALEVVSYLYLVFLFSSILL
eukprot:TRINITY_DN7178_c0_g1_i1.p1 TRINITY_DN7178_c0_g1~~TRINITY_DN7178_c0_g1_i1.p1  ORF type:complete len:786 (+),score=151.28 TRINITY_DN7178_c0_g1_i1:45-2402(+)